ncbi:rhomboid family intramembrane serine protease [Pararhodobacter oceanensis]|uniref:Rhomboid family intramembrane serine protease n=1 Tax=Pararhodobacter oceanensis TaxID=2172121 RepID=A0A2T8HRT1_9RHOB|nr:rhomboid family intramembrane serine protease [Pararhodobacter oceanensis]PVH28138.1 rhomboid family intramembrane serine protease [Pararhodobacter oceanensis]
MLVVADHNPTRHIRFAYVNWLLMIACLLVFVLRVPWEAYAFTPAHLHLVGGIKAPGGAFEIISTMASYIFLHATPLHLAGNLLAMWVFGDNIEDCMGHWRYGLFFILCGMGGAGAEALFSASPQVPVIGASGAISGLMGAYLLLHPRARVLVLVAFRVPVLVPAGVFVGLSVALDLLAALSPAMPSDVLIAFWAHLGGFASGAALITLFRARDVPLFQPATAYPEGGFLGLGRFAIDLGSDRMSLGSKVLFWAKAAVFFILITLGVEWLLA